MYNLYGKDIHKKFFFLKSLRFGIYSTKPNGELINNVSHLASSLSLWEMVWAWVLKYIKNWSIAKEVLLDVFDHLRGGGACERAHLLLQLTSWFIIARNSILLLEGICGAWEATLEFDKTFWLLFLWATMCFPFCGTWFWKTVFQMRVANLNTHYHYTQCIHQPKSMLVTKP